MWLFFNELCKSSHLLILMVISPILNVEASEISNSAHSYEFKEIFKNKFLSATDGSLEINRSADFLRNNGSLLLDHQNIDSSSNATKDARSNAAVDWSVVWPYFNTGCLQWLPINHVCFQLANVFLVLSYLAAEGLYGLIYLRLMLAIGSAFFAIWGWIIICAFDAFLWNALFCLINAIHAATLLFSLRPVALDEQVQQVYENIFRPMKVSQQQFKKVANCVKSVGSLKRGEHFAVEQETEVETLSLLLSGIMLVTEKGRTVYVVSAMQFLDSPEWFDDSNGGQFYQRSIQACEESRVLLWHRNQLQSILRKDLSLQSVFHRILGRDVVLKLTESCRNTRIVNFVQGMPPTSVAPSFPEETTGLFGSGGQVMQAEWSRWVRDKKLG